VWLYVLLQPLRIVVRNLMHLLSDTTQRNSNVRRNEL
jgi:hypothetical protein